MPALELQSRAESSVGVCNTLVVPTQGAIPENNGYTKKKKKKKFG